MSDLSRDLTKLEKEIVHDMADGYEMLSTSFHVFVRDRRTNRLLLSRLRDLEIIEIDDESETRIEQGIQHWVLNKKGKEWASANPPE